MSKSLNEWRFAAALATGGTSSKAVYDMTMGWLTRLNCGGDLLEFGAGTGNLLRSLKALGRFSSITGVDILKRPNDLSSSIKWVEADLNYPVALPDKSFDTIISTEVIEHLENPRAMAREFSRLLRAGGRILITTPNQESWRSLLSLVIRGHFVWFLDSNYPAHITALVQKDLERILKEAGFLAIEFGFSNRGGIPGRPRTTWQSVSWNLLMGRRFSDNILVIAVKQGN
jgi:2-polyprenyl-3-methyl-5-hydroxy-6-metoxy-1,4-benzoquinol methylase